MRISSSIIIILIGLTLIPNFILAQGKGGYDQYGEYVDKNSINDDETKEAEQKRLEQKLNSYQKKLKHNPKDSITFFLLGNLYVRMKRPKDAIAAFKETLKLNPWNGEAHYNLSRAYDSVRNGARAIEHVKIAEKIFTENLYLNWQTRTRQLLRQLQKQYNTQ